MALLRRNGRSVFIFLIGCGLIFAIINFSSYIQKELDSLQMKMELKHRLIDLYKDCHYRILPIIFIFGNLVNKDTSDNVLTQILWETSVHCPAFKLFYGKEEDNSTWKMVEPHRATNTKDYYHSIYDTQLELPYGSDIYFKIVTSEENPNISSISVTTTTYKTTIPTKDKPEVKIGIVADSQSETVTFKQILITLTKNQPDIDTLIHVGDYTQRGGNPNDWRTQFLNPLNMVLSNVDKNDEDVRLQTPVSYVRGNHDNFTSQYGITVDNKFKPLYYAQTYTNSRFIFLDANDDSSAQLNFLKDELESEETKNAYFRIVFVHIPPFIEYWNRKTWENGEKYWGSQVHDQYVALFEKYNVDLVVGGHSHIYQRGTRNNVNYAIVGGGGGGLENEKVEDYGFYNTTVLSHHYVILRLSKYNPMKNDKCCYLYWTAYDIEGIELDTFALASKYCIKPTK